MAPNVKEAKSGEMTWHSPKENPKSTGKPAARSGHTLACANEKAYLFGGCGIEDGGAAVFNDIWILHIADNFRWEKVDAMGDVPSPRWRHSFTFLPDNTSIFLFGGLCRVCLFMTEANQCMLPIIPFATHSLVIVAHTADLARVDWPRFLPSVSSPC